MPNAVPGRIDSAAIHRFGEFELDLARGVLLRHGIEIPLRRKSWELLCYLVTHPGRLVTKDELMEAIWAPAVVTDGALHQCVIDVRRALGDHGHQIVRTVPRRGLRFGLSVTSTPCSEAVSASVETSTDPPPATAPRYRFMLLGVLALGTASLIGWGAIAWHHAEPATTAMMASHYLGDVDQTFLWIDRAIEIRDHMALPVLRRSAIVEPLREDPRFAEAMQRFAAIEAAGSPLRPDIDALLEAQQ